MTLTQILQKIRNAFYTKKEIDSMGGGTSLSDTISQKANDSDVVHKAGNETIAGTKTFRSNIVGNLTGNADTATKATQDSDGNKINTTYSKNGHTHDNRYYTETEVNNLLNGKANTNHTHSNYLTGITKTMVTNALGYTPLSKHQDISGKANTSGTYPNLNVGYADTAGNGVDSSGDGWIRFKNGIQICYGRVNNNNNIKDGYSRYSYPVAFTVSPNIVVTPDVDGKYFTCAYTEGTSSWVLLSVGAYNGISFTTNPLAVNYMVIGKWK